MFEFLQHWPYLCQKMFDFQFSIFKAQNKPHQLAKARALNFLRFVNLCKDKVLAKIKCLQYITYRTFQSAKPPCGLWSTPIGSWRQVRHLIQLRTPLYILVETTKNLVDVEELLYYDISV